MSSHRYFLGLFLPSG